MIAALRTDVAGDRLAVTILVGIWAYIVIPSTIGQLSGATESTVSEILLLIVTAVAALVVWVRFRTVLTIAPGWLLAFALPCVYVMFRDAYAGGFAFHGVSYILIALGIAAARPSIGVLRIVGLLAVVGAILVIGLGVVRPDAAIVHTDSGDTLLRDDDKALFPAIGMLSGIFPQENNLGQFLVLGLPLLYLVRRFWVRWAGVVVVLAAILWSSSRGSMLTAGVVIVLMLVLDIVHGGARALVARLGVIAAGAVCVVLPLLGWDDTAFTDRAGIWNTALPLAFTKNPLFGLGSDWFTQQLDSSVSPLDFYASHGHNQFVQLVVTGGIVLLVLAVAQLVAVVWRNAGAPALVDNVTTLVVIGIIVNGWLEFVFGYVDDVYFWPVTFPVLAVLLFRRDPAGDPFCTPIRGLFRTRQPNRLRVGEVAFGASTRSGVRRNF